MSSPSTLYGCIFGGGAVSANQNWFFAYNKTRIDSLPETADWDPVVMTNNVFLTRDVFTIPTRANNWFYRNQMIHFGASFNGLECYWEQWLNQFEDLLRTLFWYEAHVYIKIDLGGRHEYHWESDFAPFFMDPPQPVQKWEFVGGPRSFAEFCG